MLTEQDVLEQTRCWVERVVIKNNYCPFAYQPFLNGRIRFASFMEEDLEQLAEQLVSELLMLQEADHEILETTLLVTPNCLYEFDEYNQFLDVVDEVIEQLNLDGIIQVASFHPDYQFADLDADDVRNYTNRSPHPTFHLILEESIEHARETHPDVEGIPERNMAHLQKIGLEQARRELEECCRLLAS